MSSRKLLWFSLVVLILALAPQQWLARGAEENADLRPLFGETTSEYEARTRGLTRPGPRSEPLSVTLAADSYGHFLVEPIINGIRLRMLVDTGATLVVLAREDAHRIGINPLPSDFRATVSTANGSVLVAPVLLKEVRVGELSVRDVPAAVFPDNRLQVGLLGMSFLSKLSRFEVAGARLVLKQ
jgi:aspartyl protease family protein